MTHNEDLASAQKAKDHFFSFHKKITTQPSKEVLGSTAFLFQEIFFELWELPEPQDWQAVSIGLGLT